MTRAPEARIKISVDRETARGDGRFTGTLQQQPSNSKRHETVARAASLLYVVRVMSTDDIPIIKRRLPAANSG